MQIRRIGIALAVNEPRIDYFVEQLRSIEKQTFTEWICVISFDSPADRVMFDERLRPWRDHPRVRWIEDSHGPRGAASNFERAMRLALLENVDAIACCDYDDRWYPDKLATLATALERAGPLGLVHSDLDLFDASGPLAGTAWTAERRLADHVAPWQLLVRNTVTGCSMLIDAELVRRYPVVPAAAHLHDRWYALVAACHGGVHSVERPLLAYRLHDAQDTGLARYRGLLAAPPGVRGTLGLLRECVRVWLNADGLLTEALARGLPVPIPTRSLYRARDLGVGLAARGALHIRGDPVLARAALAAAGGKLLTALSRGRILPLPERTAVPRP